VNDLQRIFTSRHANESTELRHQLLNIEEEAEKLRRKIAELEQEQKVILHGAESKQEKEKEAGEKNEKEAAENADSDEFDADASVPAKTAAGDGSQRSKLEVSKSGMESEEGRKLSKSRRQGMIFQEDERKNHQEALLQQLEQTAKQQENLIGELESELKDLHLQKEKQDKWTAKLQGEVLDTEITKVRYRVRLESATARSKGLSELLKGSYEKMSTLLKDRVASEEESAKNDAILQYLQVVFKSNTLEFQDNREQLRGLMHKCQDNKQLKQRVCAYDAQLRKEQNIAKELIQKTDELQRKLEAVQAFWMTIPADVKTSVQFQEEAAAFKAKRTMVHPLNAIRSIKEGVSILTTKQQHVLRTATDLLDKSPIIGEQIVQEAVKPSDLATESHPFEVQ
jgi:hypothetical protein